VGGVVCGVWCVCSVCGGVGCVCGVCVCVCGVSVTCVGVRCVCGECGLTCVWRACTGSFWQGCAVSSLTERAVSAPGHLTQSREDTG